MSKIEIVAIIKNKFSKLDSTESKILEEFCEAMKYRLTQIKGTLSEAQCLKSWEAYLKERMLVYNKSVSSKN